MTFLIVLLSICQMKTQAQEVRRNNKLSMLSIYGGFDQAAKNNFTSYGNGKLNGFTAGVDYAKYFGVLGIAVGLDYTSNKAPTYNAAGFAAEVLPFVDGVHFNSIQSASKLTRTFLGLGPTFKVLNRNTKLLVELSLKGGVSIVDGSALRYATKSTVWAPWMERDGDATGPVTSNGAFYHRGYANDKIATVKSQIRVGYFVSPKIAVNLGVHYQSFLGSKAQYNYLDWKTPTPYWSWLLSPSFGVSKLSSVGATAGISFAMHSSAPGKTKKGKAKTTLTVNVKDELTNLPLANAVISTSNEVGEILSATTDAVGNAVFNKIAAGHYQVSGVLHEIATTEQAININGTDKNAIVNLLHNDPRFTLQGKAINLSSKKGESNVQVSLKNDSKGSVKMATSQVGSGSFDFQLEPNSDYNLVGKKASYISNIENVSTKGLTRSQTLYVELELGVESAEAGKSILLNKIYYDLDKAAIREDASSDLEKLVQFLQDNPGFKIEIASHTDSRGEDNYNLKLSQQRAEAVVKYLSAKSIPASRMSARGYGEARLINRCGNNANCTETEHQENRRTEFKVITE